MAAFCGQSIDHCKKLVIENEGKPSEVLRWLT